MARPRARGGADPGARQDRDDSFSHVPARLSGRYRWSGIKSGAQEGCVPGEEAGMDPVVAAFGTALVEVRPEYGRNGPRG